MTECPHCKRDISEGAPVHSFSHGTTCQETVVKCTSDALECMTNTAREINTTKKISCMLQHGIDVPCEELGSASCVGQVVIHMSTNTMDRVRKRILQLKGLVEKKEMTSC